MSRTKIVIQKEYFSAKQCSNNPTNLYIFGDNVIRHGKGGQAIIRDCENSFGIATKRLPTNRPEAFFSDSVRDTVEIVKDLNKLFDIYESGKWDAIVFPADGIGTGLADMPNKCPKIFEKISKSLNIMFGITLTENGFVESY